MLPQRFFEIELTNRCNLNCIHCRNSVSNSRSLSFEAVDKILENIFSFPSEDKYIALSGGEPLLYPHIREIIEKIVSKDIEAQVITNATVMADNFLKFVERFPKDKLYFAVSLDGDRNTHNEIRGWDKAFDATVESIKKLKAIGFQVGVNFTLNSKNVGQLDFVYNFCIELGANILKVRMPIECGRVSYKDKNFSLHKEYLSVLEKAVRLSENSFERHGIRVESNDPLWWYFPSKIRDKVLKRIENGENDCLGGCTAGWLQLFIDSNGDVFPCAYLPVKLGNAVSDDLCEIIYHKFSFFYDIMNRDTFTQCGNCKYKLICGGCRARAYLKEGNFFDSDPFCPFNFETDG